MPTGTTASQTTYSVIPAQHRILWVNSVDLVWNAILASLSNQDEVTLIEDDEEEEGGDAARTSNSTIVVIDEHQLDGLKLEVVDPKFMLEQDGTALLGTNSTLFESDDAADTSSIGGGSNSTTTSASPALV